MCKETPNRAQISKYCVIATDSIQPVFVETGAVQFFFFNTYKATAKYMYLFDENRLEKMTANIFARKPTVKER